MEPHLLEFALKYLPYVLTLLVSILMAIIFFAIQLWRYGPDIRKLNRFETVAQLAYFADQQAAMTKAFGEATATSHRMRQAVMTAVSDLETLKEFVAEALERMSEYNADSITRSRLDEAVPPPIPPRLGLQDFNSVRVSAADDKPSAARYKNMMMEWERFLDVFKRRLTDAKIQINLNRIGRMVYQLSDRRRRHPLPLETADLITALHSQYKRYIRMQGTKESWLTKEVHDDFVKLIQTAIDELSQTNNDRAPDPAVILGGGNGQMAEEPSMRM